MNLREKRALNTFQTEHYPQWEQKIREAIGFEVPLEIEWETLMYNTPGEDIDYTHLVDESWKRIYFEPFVEALVNLLETQLS